MFAHKLTQQSFRGVLVASALDQCVKNKPILIDRAPKPMFRTIDCDDDFIEMPFVAELRRAAADFIGEVPTKFLRPTPHGFMADDNPPHGQHVFNHPQAERETKIEPNRVGDHLGGETMTTVQGVMSFHPRSIPAPLPHSVNVTVPVASANGHLTLHFLPGYAPELNPDELVWSHVKRTGVARSPLRKGEKLSDKVEAQLAKIQKMPQLIRSFFQAPSLAYITDC